MIKAIIFDLDGTLIQTEILKAKSYAQAINILTNDRVSVQRVLDGFKNYVGLSRPEVVAGLAEEFKRELHKNMKDNDPKTIQEKVLSKRLSIYHNMVNDSKLLSNYFCPFNLGLLHAVHKDNFKIVLATMSHLPEAKKVLDAIGIAEIFDHVLTREDVNNGKPDPEIYLKAKELLKIKASECLVIEDSVNGIKAALNAQMHVFVVTNSITSFSVHHSNLLTEKSLIDNPKELKGRVYEFINNCTLTSNLHHNNK
jgi:beta-phosphoglucomutase-like phosphatase (HAD superfamily)